MTESLTRTCVQTLDKTYAMFNYKTQNPYRISAPKVEIKALIEVRDTNVYERYVKIPWC
jgi:hypothetical protein